MKNNTIIDNRMQNLGITRKYKGYYQLKLAIELALEDEDRLCSVAKNLYRPVAEICGCSQCSVYRNICTLSDNIWNYHYDALSRIAVFKLTNKITATDMIAILVADILRSQYNNVS